MPTHRSSESFCQMTTSSPKRTLGWQSFFLLQFSPSELDQCGRFFNANDRQLKSLTDLFLACSVDQLSRVGVQTKMQPAFNDASRKLKRCREWFRNASRNLWLSDSWVCNLPIRIGQVGRNVLFDCYCPGRCRPISRYGSAVRS